LKLDTIVAVVVVVVHALKHNSDIELDRLIGVRSHSLE
jgi:hypothetical protein